MQRRQISSFILVAIILLGDFTPIAVAEAAVKHRWWSLFGSPDLLLVKAQNQNYVRVRPRLGIDAQFPFGMTLGNEFSSHTEPYGPGRVKRTQIGFRFGWNFFERRLQLVTRLASVSTSYSNYESDSADSFGAEGVYRIPLSERFGLNIGAGWTYQKQVTLRRDTGTPISDSAFSNALCSFFTLGVASGCGNLYTRLTIPQSSYWHTGVGLEWIW